MKQTEQTTAPRRQQLPESSRKVLAWVAEQLRGGYTGRFELECYGGGVRQVRSSQVYEGRELDGLLPPRNEGA